MSKLEYNIIAEIKKSNKGNVYLAAVEGQALPVIVKEIKYGNIKVYEALKNISNIHLPQILHVEEIDEGILIVEEYIEGELLSEYINQHKLTEDGCLYIAEQMCDVLKMLHSHIPALIHRDIKPSNIIVGKDGAIKLIDFDSSRLYNDEADSDTRFLGTEKYAPPEQYGFSQTDCRSDIYSLGVVFEKFTQFMSRTRVKKWKSMVEKCTLFSPDSRFQNVDEIRVELNRIRKSVAPVVALLACACIGVLCISVLFMNTDRQNMQGDKTTTSKVAVEEDKSTQEEETSYDAALDPQYINVAPEWRDLSSDSLAYVSFKEELRKNNGMVIYYIKDRKYSADFLYQEGNLNDSSTELVGMSLSAVADNTTYSINKQYIKVTDNVIAVSREYMDKLENGYYMLNIQIRNSSGQILGGSVPLYVASSDVYEETGWRLQNTTFEYSGEDDEKVNLLVQNHCGQSLLSLQVFEGPEVDESLYNVLQEGRILELSSELLNMYKDHESIDFEAVFDDGKCEIITVYNRLFGN